MKIKEKDFSNLLKSDFANVPAMLIYSPDNGKINDYISKVIEKMGIDTDNLVSASGSDFKDNFESVFSNACSSSMFGGNKLIVIRDPDGRDLSFVTQLCESAISPVIITAGELESKSSLRKYFEDHEKFAVMPLYADDEQSLGAIIRSELSKFEITKIESDALSYMYQHLGKDRAVARSFLRKIALYVDDKKSVVLEDVQKCLPDTGAANMDSFKYNLTSGNLLQTLRSMDRMFAENMNTTMMTRMLGTHFKDLLNCVVGGIMPRVFWKFNSHFEKARHIWNEDEIINVLTRLNRLESDLRSGLDDEIIFRDFALKLGTRAYKLATAKK